MSLIVFFDTETSGLKVEQKHRIIEIAMVGYDLDTEQKRFEFVRRINPHRAIDPMAQLVHKISQSELIGKPSFLDIEPLITKILQKTHLLVAHNLLFDAKFLMHEFDLIGKQLPDVQSFCTMTSGRWATSNGKLPNLGELCWATGVDYDTEQAHSALYDCEVLAQCFFVGVKENAFKIKELL